MPRTMRQRHAGRYVAVYEYREGGNKRKRKGAMVFYSSSKEEAVMEARRVLKSQNYYDRVTLSQPIKRRLLSVKGDEEEEIGE